VTFWFGGCFDGWGVQQKGRIKMEKKNKMLKILHQNLQFHWDEIKQTSGIANSLTIGIKSLTKVKSNWVE
jgi:hypothetical protein